MATPDLQIPDKLDLQHIKCFVASLDFGLELTSRGCNQDPEYRAMIFGRVIIAYVHISH